MKNVSMIVHHSKVEQNASLKEVFELIKRPDSIYRQKIEEIRQLFKSGSAQAADDLKKTLPGFTASGIFGKKRKTDCLAAYSGMLILDLDDLMPSQVNHVKDVVNAIPYTHMSFISPSGLGLKIVVKVDSSADVHKAAYEQVKKLYEDETGEQFDRTTDIARLCYVSYDTDAYFNEESSVFKVDATKINKLKVVCTDFSNKNELTVEKADAFTKALNFTEKKQKFSIGNRNNFISLLSTNCNRYGLPVEITLEKCLEFYSDGWDEKEITSTITGVYNRYDDQFGQWREYLATDSSKRKGGDTKVPDEENDNDTLLSVATPTIPALLVEKMPVIIKQIALMFTDERERDVFITGMLAVLSGSMYSVSGIYDGDLIYPTLFVFVVAPAASGKGSMKIARQVAEDLHDKMVEESKANLLKYNQELEDYNEAKKRREKTGEKPISPPFKMLFVPGNSSSAAIYEHLRDTDGFGIVFETEADTISSTLKNDWANYSDLLRRAFHHESLSSKRKTNKEYIEVKRPKPSIALSGTIDQVPRLIHSAENGLFSRFIFYRFQEMRIWRDVSPSNGKYVFPKIVGELAKKFTKMIQFLDKYPTSFELSAKQWSVLNKAFERQLKDTACFVGEEVGASIIRLGIITFRMAMIFSAIKKYDDGNKKLNILCTDEHFDLALRLMQVFLVHTMAVYSELPARRKPLDAKLEKFVDKLPIEFERKGAILIAEQIGFNISDSTIDKYLRRLVEYGYLEKDPLEYNLYRKIKSIETTGEETVQKNNRADKEQEKAA